MTSLEILSKDPVFFYTGVPIAPSGQGSSMRVFTNLRAYADLGFKIEVIQVVNKDQHIDEPILPNPSIKYTLVEQKNKNSDSCLNRFHYLLRILSFYLSFPKNLVLSSMYPNRSLLLQSVQSKINLRPDAIFHFEYDHFASAAVGFKHLNAVWSNHDILSERIPLLWQMRSEIKELSSRSLYRKLRLKRLRQAEDWIAEHCKLILNIAQHEQIEFCQNRQYTQAELFPMSWPDEEAPERQQGWMTNGILRMLHLGSIDGFVGYDSLKFILEQVFPLLPSDCLELMDFIVVGRIGETQYSQQILELAQKYPQVKFLGFVKDIKSIYANCDLQLVGGLRATGLRTRIIESFVYGLPVLSTSETAKGLVELRNGENILLADDATEFAKVIEEIIERPNRLRKIAREGRVTYDTYYSRQIAAQKLADFLQRYF